ncbi:hypothetical protein KY289_035382 [Solanum tuberosum]|nr:hypothetical protein KY289_035382 [Solanum tuberosum]
MTKPRRHNKSKAKKPTNKSFSSHPWECSFCKKNFNQTTQEHADHEKICEKWGGGDAVGSNANVKQKKIKAEQAMLAEKEKRRAEELAAIKAKKEHARKSGWKKK